MLRFVSNEFQENKEPTIGAAFLTVSDDTSGACIQLMLTSKNAAWTML